MEININKKLEIPFELSNKAIEEFQQICFEDYGKKISKEEAQLFGYNLLRVFKLSLRSKEVSNG